MEEIITVEHKGYLRFFEVSMSKGDWVAIDITNIPTVELTAPTKGLILDYLEETYEVVSYGKK